jgi:hypothetical protein
MGLASIAAGVFTTRMTLRHAEKRDYSKELRRTINEVAASRFRLVTALMEFAHCEAHDRATHLERVQERYDDLRLAAQNQSQLRESEDLVSACRRFKVSCVDPARKGLLQGHQLARRTREVAEDFNVVLYHHGAAVGLSPASFSRIPS